MSYSVAMRGNSLTDLEKTRFSGLKDLVNRRRGVDNNEGEERDKGEQKNEAGGETFHWVLNPQSHLRHYYLVFMVILTFVNLITVPLDIAFSDDMHYTAHKYWMAFNVFSDILFCIDVGLNFRMGIFNEDGQVILDPKLIRQDYFRSWLVPDVVAAFPVDVIIIIVEHFYHADTLSLLASKMVRILMFVRILSLIRLLRVPKLLRFCVDLESVTDIQLEEVKKTFRVIFVFLMTALIWHWNTCVQYFLSVIEEFPKDSWVVQEKIVNSSIGEKYSYASFRAFSQMAWRSTESVAKPRRVDERWLAFVSMVIGFLICLALIYCVMSAVWSLSVTCNANKMKINRLQSSTMFQKLPRMFRQRTTAWYKWKWDKENILDTLPIRLRKDIMAEICSNLINKYSVFLTVNREFTEAILIKLEKEFFNAGDDIIHQDAEADHMFFIDYGRVLMKNKSFHKELCDGDHFGEISFLFGGRQLATVSALTACSLFSLSLQEFQEIEEKFPDVVYALRVSAQQLKNAVESGEVCVQVASASSSV